MTCIVTNDRWKINITSSDFRKVTDHVLWVAHHILLWLLTHCGRVTQICVFNTVKLGTSASSP